MRHTFKKALLSLAVIAVVCSSLLFAGCKKKLEVKETPIPQSEIQALKDFYKATGGENWTKTWDTTNNDISTWEGVATDKIVVDLKNRVLRTEIVAIKLPDNNLTGNIPIDILVQLKDIKIIDFSNNQLTGGIPDALSQLKNITWIDFSNNKLTGGIPESLGQLENITRIYFSNNKLTGGIPESLSQLSDLYILDLSYNNLTGTLPQAIKNMKNYSSFKLCEQGDDALGYYCPFQN